MRFALMALAALMGVKVMATLLVLWPFTTLFALAVAVAVIASVNLVQGHWHDGKDAN